ncbi:uncharacterized protein LOC112550023 [Alligator sinensis]|uniref:Uncharacterized protein LOC112550023 n=1 Tax=Alligator sinensis TaxID=38654 RepID=A0A3Q0GEB6_ALLSI|nr:uncharacterized protein LOC112550023 [Alligator sinensis]
MAPPRMFWKKEDDVTERMRWSRPSGVEWRRPPSVLSSLHRFAAPFQSLPLDTPIHNFKPGDQVLEQKWKKNPLAERWEGPYQVLLTTHTAVRLKNNDKWTHCLRVKLFRQENTNSQGVVTPKADNTREQKADKWTSEPVGDLKLCLQKCEP